MICRYYLGEFSLQTKASDSIKDLNLFLTKLGSRQTIQKRPYKRQYKYELVSYTNQGKFVGQIFDLGEIVNVKPHNSIITERA